MARLTTKLDDGTVLRADRTQQMMCRGKRLGVDCGCWGDMSHIYEQGPIEILWRYDGEDISKERALELLQTKTTQHDEATRKYLIDLFINGAPIPRA